MKISSLDMVDVLKSSKISTAARPGKNSWCPETRNHVSGNAVVLPNIKRDKEFMIPLFGFNQSDQNDGLLPTTLTKSLNAMV